MRLFLSLIHIYINKEYILKRVQETEDLQKEIADLEDTLQKPVGRGDNGCA